MMKKTCKEDLKKKINSKINELVDGADMIGSLDHFEINIKHTERDLSINLVNKYKEKIQ